MPRIGTYREKRSLLWLLSSTSTRTPDAKEKFMKTAARIWRRGYFHRCVEEDLVRRGRYRRSKNLIEDTHGAKLLISELREWVADC